MSQEGCLQQARKLWKNDPETLSFVVETVLPTSNLTLAEALEREFFMGKEEYGEFDSGPKRVIYGPVMTVNEMKSRWEGGDFCQHCLKGSKKSHHDLYCPVGPWQLYINNIEH